MAKPFKKTALSTQHTTHTQRRKIMVRKTQFAFLLFLRKASCWWRHGQHWLCLSACVHTLEYWNIRHRHIRICMQWMSYNPTEHFERFPESMPRLRQNKTSQTMPCHAALNRKPKRKPIWYMLRLHPNQSFFFFVFFAVHFAEQPSRVWFIGAKLFLCGFYFGNRAARLDIQIKYSWHRRR